MPYKFSFLVMTLVFTMSTHAQTLSAGPKSASASFTQFIKDVDSRIPTSVKAAIKTYKVEYVERELPADICNTHVNLDGLVRTDFLGLRKRIYLKVYPEQKLSCPHTTASELAKKALLFQVASLYDQSPGHWQNKADQAALAQCESEHQQDRKAPLSPRCQYYLENRFRVSGSANYRNLSDYKGQRLHSKNKLDLRLLNEHETDSASEHFAIHFSEFLLNPDFECRKPAFHSYFVALTGRRPFPAGSCQGVSHIFTSTGAWKIDIAPEKVYQVHFLYASKGEEMMSRWGHSMLRLVVCAPFRTVVGPECLTDVAFHLVLSYRANIDDVIINYWDGLTGKYPSQLMAFSMPEVIDEYTRGQWRDLISLPLRISEAQKNLLVQSALEHYWSYAGDYKFLTNNCASETDQLVRAALTKNHSYQDSFAASPKGMYKNLIRYGVVDSQLVIDPKEAQRKGYFFPSQKESLDRAFSKMNDHFSNYASLAEFAEYSSALERRSVYAELESFEEIGRAYLIEKYVALVQQRKQQKLISTSLQNNQDHSLSEVIDKLVEASQDRLPWRLAHGGYGVPLQTEVLTDEAVGLKVQEGRKWGGQYQDLLLKKFPEVDEELKGIKQNLELLTNRRRL
ncbi:lipoprotein N-acyltransferase Lnb domain-containing protein [Bdellovibrio reynosensis]|uniref:DUF4105 domain-containing protein n=1 Tax=Bdellovibrio reynosensis TaxID=2835041 RepID=A0ABY4CBS0_9BACT|nr:DUF4105 domain-containing protein [Bdellovibrio reynosensis]UOF02390.1 DUF4105 domain-containing protein [Bdellovibrio reynosensis]